MFTAFSYRSDDRALTFAAMLSMVWCGLATGQTAPADPDPTPNSQLTQSSLAIYCPQNGPAVPEKKAYTVGSFSVVNMNDTCGNGTATAPKSDLTTSPVLSVQSALTSDACGLIVDVADGSKFDMLVDNGPNTTDARAPNRIRVKDDDGGELAYIAIRIGNRLWLQDKLNRTYKKARNAKAEIGEVDLMKLVMDSPVRKPAQGNAVLTIVKGNIKLWQDENKAAAVVMDIASPSTLTFPLAQLPKTVWIECVETDVTKLAVRGIELKLQVGTVADTVRATAVWAQRSDFWDTAKVVNNPNPPPPTIKTLNGFERGPTILDTFKRAFNSDLGMGTFAKGWADGPLMIGGRQESEFRLFPPGVGGEPDVVVDCSRRVAFRDTTIQWGKVVALPPKDMPTAGWNRFEVATDDGVTATSPTTENKPTNDRVYQIDGPSIDTTYERDFLIRRCSFQEFVRLKFGPGVSLKGSAAPCVEGSRGSCLEGWHLLLYVRRNEQAIGKEQTYTWDSDAVSTSFALASRSNSGTGTCESTPNAINGVTEGWTVQYAKGPQEDHWEVTGKDGSVGTLTKAGNTWTGTASKDGKVRITITVTADPDPAKAFKNGDLFRFSTFKTGAAKKNEVKTGEVDITAGP